MAREEFYRRKSAVGDGAHELTATLHYDDTRFGAPPPTVSPWNIAVRLGDQDFGRIVGFEGEGRTILDMHHLKADPAAQRGCEITVFRMADELLVGDGASPAAAVFSAFERWLLKRGWRGDIVKKLKFTAEDQVQPIRRFWLAQGFELVPFREGDGGWDEHVVKRWR
jgi:hypothetical protein